MRRFAFMNFQISTTADSKLSYTPCYVQVRLISDETQLEVGTKTKRIIGWIF